MRDRRNERGFALAALIVFITAALIVTAAVVPAYQMQAKRQREQELIFRGEEYIRAIEKFQRKYQAFPGSVDDLLLRDGFRFLRKAYVDPITGEEFRLIRVNADGTLTGSLTMATIPIPANAGQGGIGDPGGGRGGSTGAAPSGPGTVGNTNPFGASTSLGTMSGFSLGGGTNNQGAPPRGGQGGGRGNQAPAPAFGAAGGQALGTVGGGGVGNVAGGGLSPFAANQPQGADALQRPGVRGGTADGPRGGGGPGGGGVVINPGIAGVASDSTTTGVMVYNTKEKYNEWEFISPFVMPTVGAPIGAPSGPGGANNGRGGPQPSTPGTLPTNSNPFGTPVGPAGNPFGTPAGQGGGRGQPQGNTNPFGGGGTAPAPSGGQRR